MGGSRTRTPKTTTRCVSGPFFPGFDDRLHRILLAADRLGVLDGAEAPATPRTANWREEPLAEEVPESLDDILADDALDIDEEAFTLHHTTPAAERHTPDHRAEFVPCPDFETFRQRFEDMQAALEAGDRHAVPVRKWAVIEPQEGDFFIRGGLLALIVEKSEMSARGGSRDHRLRVVFSNGTESDPLMSSFRKSLNDDKTARMVERVGIGPLDPDWELDRLDLSGTIYVARSLSDAPEIVSQRKILHKIGVTSQDARRRVADARNDPTFLLAPVEIVATYELANLPRRKVEELLHRFFEPARPGQLFITDRFGKKVYPREWFYVLPDHVGQAAKLHPRRHASPLPVRPNDAGDRWEVTLDSRYAPEAHILTSNPPRTECVQARRELQRIV